LKRFGKNPKTVEFPNYELINRKFPGGKSNGTEMSEFSGKEFSNYMGIPCVLFSGNSGKCCSFDIRNFCEFKPEFLVEWKAPLYSH